MSPRSGMQVAGRYRLGQRIAVAGMVRLLKPEYADDASRTRFLAEDRGSRP
ncbi:MAG: hypothetical protein M3Q87_11685 [Actinomycetota bacterium]|nr:hypothetical protein [Actinomycetota bacterium]